VTVAIPIWQQRVSPLLDTATRLLVLRCRDGQEVSREELRLGAQSPLEVAQALTDRHVNLVLCGALSKHLLLALEEQGIQVRPHLCGDVEVILDALCHDQLAREQFRMPGCREVHSSPAVPMKPKAASAP